MLQISKSISVSVSYTTLVLYVPSIGHITFKTFRTLTKHLLLHFHFYYIKLQNLSREWIVCIATCELNFGLHLSNGVTVIVLCLF